VRRRIPPTDAFNDAHGTAAQHGSDGSVQRHDAAAAEDEEDAAAAAQAAAAARRG